MNEIIPIECGLSETIPTESKMNEVLNARFQPRTWLVRATILAASLGLIHLLATPLYFDQWLGYGVFFVALAALQVMYSMALAVAEPNRVLLWFGIIGHALVIALWAVTRTVGIPLFGPMAGEVLSVGLLDATAQIMIAILIVHLGVLLNQFNRLCDRPLIE